MENQKITVVIGMPKVAEALRIALGLDADDERILYAPEPTESLKTMPVANIFVPDVEAKDRVLAIVGMEALTEVKVCILPQPLIQPEPTLTAATQIA